RLGRVVLRLHLRWRRRRRRFLPLALALGGLGGGRSGSGCFLGLLLFLLRLLPGLGVQSGERGEFLVEGGQEARRRFGGVDGVKGQGRGAAHLVRAVGLGVEQRVQSRLAGGDLECRHRGGAHLGLAVGDGAQGQFLDLLGGGQSRQQLERGSLEG